jgi:hypothetical protein
MTKMANMWRATVASAALSVAVVTAGPVMAAPVTDIVFIIDASSSMGGEINGVRNGFGAFASNLSAQGVDARFAIVMFGGEPELILDFTNDATLVQARLNAMVIGTAPGIHNNHNLNPEAGLEAIRMVLGGAVTNSLANNNIPEDGILEFRAGVRKNLILATDEDSDRSFNAANQFAGQTTLEPPSTIDATWQAEVDATADAVIAAQAFVNMLINRGEAPSRSQYGDPLDDVSDSDFTDWDQAATLANLLANPVTANSLEAQILAAGLIARAFDVAGANDPDFVDNFFQAKVEEIITDPGIPVPEPMTLTLLALGFVGIAAVRRRWAH